MNIADGYNPASSIIINRAASGRVAQDQGGLAVYGIGIGIHVFPGRGCAVEGKDDMLGGDGYVATGDGPFGHVCDQCVMCNKCGNDGDWQTVQTCLTPD